MNARSPWTDRRRQFQDWPNYRWAVLGLTMAGIAATSFPITVLGSSDSAERYFAIFVLAAAIGSLSALSARWSPGLGIASSAGASRRSRS